MLHGCTQDPVAFAAATLMNDQADRHGFVVLYPGQDQAAIRRDAGTGSSPSISGAMRASRRRSSQSSAI
jgi:poly(3-hydroxybutyrate) depolymerase